MRAVWLYVGIGVMLVGCSPGQLYFGSPPPDSGLEPDQKTTTDGPTVPPPKDGQPPPKDGQPPRPDLGDVDGPTPGGPPPDPCFQKVCDRPPPAVCVDNKRLRTFAVNGVCKAGKCEYQSTEQTCSGSCVAGLCLDITKFLHVDARNGGSENGSRSAPYRSISAAISAASSDTGILVAAGTYSSIRIAGKRIVLIGGYPGASASAYSSGQDGDFDSRGANANVTVIRQGNPVVRLENAAKSLVIGFEIRDGSRGIYCSGGQPTVSECRITGHRSGSNGGGVFISGCDLTLTNSVIAQNRAPRGGGIASQGGNIEIRGNSIRDNISTDDHGGGVYLIGQIELHDNHFEGNEVGRQRGYGWGGAIVILNRGTVAHLSGNIATDNYAVSGGSAAFLDDGSESYLDNELYFKNRCAETGSGILVDGLSGGPQSHAYITNSTIADHNCSGGNAHGVLAHQATADIKNCILWNNGRGEVASENGGRVTVTFSNLSVNVSGSGNISKNPQFVGGGEQPYRLKSGGGHWDGKTWINDSATSPCIDTGDPGSGVGNEPSPNGNRANMGAYGRTPTASKSP
jgi:hypothetical protein